MSKAYPREVYRRPSKRLLSQGDIALAEYHQLRASGGEAVGPGPAAKTAADLPFFGDARDYRLSIPAPEGKTLDRVLRVWSGPVVVVSQGCELEFRNEADSRLQVAPLVSRPQWPEGPWEPLIENLVPGYFYLPSIPFDQANEFGMSEEFPESVVVLASSTLSSVGLIKPRRILGLAADMIPRLQESIVRAASTRGFAGMRELEGVVGKRIVKVTELNQSISGPSRLAKVYFGEQAKEVNDGDDELTVAYWGVRPTAPRGDAA